MEKTYRKENILSGKENYKKKSPFHISENTHSIKELLTEENSLLFNNKISIELGKFKEFPI